MLAQSVVRPPACSLFSSLFLQDSTSVPCSLRDMRTLKHTVFLKNTPLDHTDIRSVHLEIDFVVFPSLISFPTLSQVG